MSAAVKHTPGPWRNVFTETNKRTHIGQWYFVSESEGQPIVNLVDRYNFSTTNISKAEANARLIAAAPEMLVALAKLVCPECNHELQHHADKHGCEIERGDREGNEGEPAQAMGPCGCSDDDLRDSFPDYVRAIEAIRKAKGIPA